jgi:hypothetical protein
MHFLHELPSTIRAKFLDQVLRFKAICIFCTNCRFGSAGTISPRSARLEKFPRRDLRAVLNRVTEPLQPCESRFFDNRFGKAVILLTQATHTVRLHMSRLRHFALRRSRNHSLWPASNADGRNASVNIKT